MLGTLVGELNSPRHMWLKSIGKIPSQFVYMHSLLDFYCFFNQACNPEGSSKVFELLQGKTFRSIGWSTLFDCLSIYEEKFKQSLQTPGALLPEFQEGDAKALVAYLNVLKQVIILEFLVKLYSLLSLYYLQKTRSKYSSTVRRLSFLFIYLFSFIFLFVILGFLRNINYVYGLPWYVYA